MADDKAHNVFISWSGDLSGSLATQIAQWIPLVIQSANPYFSKNNAKGTDWQGRIRDNLKSCKIGLVIVTPENKESPWLLFESGALSNHFDDSKVCPILFELNESDVGQPLSSFHFTKFNKPDLFSLLQSINNSLDLEKQINDSILHSSFEAFWVDFEKSINDIIYKNKNRIRNLRTSEEKIEEILLTIRSIDSSLKSPASIRDGDAGGINAIRRLQTFLRPLVSTIDRLAFECELPNAALHFLDQCSNEIKASLANQYVKDTILDALGATKLKLLTSNQGGEGN